MGIIDLLTVKETADLLKTSRQQVRKMIRSGLIPAVRIGREWRIDETYLREFLDQHLSDGMYIQDGDTSIFQR